MLVLAGFFESTIFYVLLLVACFGVIALIAFLLRKYVVKPHANEEDKLDEKKIAEEELNRILVPMDEGQVQKVEDENVEDNVHDDQK